MKVISQLCTIIILLGFVACENDQEKLNPVFEEVVGVWINPQYNDSICTYDRTDSLKVNEPGFKMMPNGWLTERKNAGWCGTPPIAYSDFEGMWSKQDSIITFTVAFWGGHEEVQWEVISLKNDHLTVRQIQHVYHYNE